MKSFVKTWVALIFVLLACFSWSAQAQLIKANHSSIEIISELSSVIPGQRFTLGLHVVPDSGWHNYWVNPGDAGKDTKIDKWASPAGVVVSDIQYPTPHVVPFGDMITYAYEGENTLLLDLSVPADFAGESVQLTARVSWLVCDDKSCVPERGLLDMSLPIGDGGKEAGVQSLFSAAREHFPVPEDWAAAYYLEGDNVVFEVAFPPQQAQDVYLFPAAIKLTNAGAGQKVHITDGLLNVTAVKGTRAEKYQQSIVVVTYADGSGEKKSVALTATRVASAGTVAAARIISTQQDAEQQFGFWGVLIAAFIGGLVLNLMPCVLPVLSLKMLSLVQMSRQHPRWVRESGVFYSLGVMGSFTMMALVIIALRIAGESVGWGFQMQNPLVLMILMLLMVLIGLNLLGVFEFGGGLMNIGAEKTEGRSNTSSFWTGVLAVVVATPCTAPFMAVALGYAFIQPWYISLVIFLTLGFGLAFPYLLIAFVPAARRFIPSPGAWMSVFKSALAFPMFGTAIWLLWVLGDKDAMMWALASVLMLSIATWAWGMRPMSSKPVVWKAVAVLFLVLMFVFPFRWTLDAKDAAADLRQAGVAAGGSHLGEAVYSESLLMEKLAEGKAVFAYFTADWCITCKINEKGSVHTDEVQDYFVNNNIEVMVGDYTHYDESITQVLSLYNRVGVPLYLYFEPGDKVAGAKVLPQTMLVPNSLLSEIR